MSALPIIVDTFFEAIDLEPGEYAWCSCGKSKKQPFCDDSHIGTDFAPVCFEVTQAKRYKLCLCKHTNKPPYCDNQHGKL